MDWRNIEYNHGNHFDGTTFVAPFKGLYSFLSTAVYETYITGSTINSSKVECFVNDIRAYSALSNSTGRANQSGSIAIASVGQVLMQTTLQLNSKDRVYIKLDGSFSNLNNRVLNYFEGRLISEIDE